MTGRTSYRANLDRVLVGTYAALLIGFAVSWLAVALTDGDHIAASTLAATAGYCLATVLLVRQTYRRDVRLRHLLAFGAVATLAYLAGRADLAVAPGIGIMPLVAAGVGLAGFARGRAAVLAAGTVLVLPVLEHLVAGEPVAAFEAVWPVVAGTVAAAVVVRTLGPAADSADLAAAAAHDSELRAAAAAARHDSHRDVQGLLHDDVVAALRAISLPQVTAAEARAAAADAVRAVRRTALPVSDDEPLDLAALVRALPPIAVPVAVHAPPAVMVPGAVARALVGATGEALRNVARHARARTATLTLLERDGEVWLTVADDGVGYLGPSRPDGSHGLRQSVHERVEAVGGTVEVSGRAGHGTVVHLGWRPPSPARPTRVPRATRIRAAIGDVRPPMAAATLPFAAASLVLAVRHTLGGFNPPWALVWQVALTAGLLWVVRRADRPLPLLPVVGLLALALGGASGYLVTMPSDALVGQQSWPSGAPGPLLAALAIVQPGRRVWATVAGQQVVLTAVVLTGRFGPMSFGELNAMVLPAAMSVVWPVLMGAYFGRTLESLGAVVTRSDEANRARAAGEVAARARFAMTRRRLADLNVELLPFLEQVAEGPEPADPDAVRVRAAELADLARDELHLPGVLDAATRELLRRARAAGCVLTLQSDGPVVEPEPVRALLAAGLAAGAACSEVVLTVRGEAAETRVSLVALLRQDEDRQVHGVVARLAAGLAAAGGQVRTLSDAVWAEARFGQEAVGEAA